MKLIHQRKFKILNKKVVNLTNHYKKLAEVLDKMLNKSTLKYNYFYTNKNGEHIYLASMSEEHARNALNYFKNKKDNWQVINNRPWWDDPEDDLGYFLFEPYY